MVALFSYTANSQAITKAAAIAYTNGVPAHTPSSSGSEIAINTVNKDFYFWNGSAWVNNSGTGAFVRTTSPTLVTPDLGVPSFLTLTNATGLPISTGVSGLGTGVATFLATPSSANLAAALTDETGTGSAVFGTSPTISLPTINRINNGFTTTATAAGTTTLTSASTYLQFFTGTSTQTVQLPDVTTLAQGTQFYIRNLSTSNITITSSGGNTVRVLGPNTRCIVTCILTTGTTAASWSAMYLSLSVADGKVLTVNNNLTLSGTDGSTITTGAGGTIAYTDVANTFTQNQIFTLPALTGSTATNGIDISQTWNTSGSPSIININATNSNSSASPSFVNLRLSGTSLFRVNGFGQLIHTPPNFGGGSGNLEMISTTSTWAAGVNSSNFRPLSINYTINTTGAQTGTATGIFLNATETALNGMTHNLMDLQVGGTSVLRVGNALSTATTGTVNSFSHTASFAPTSGTAVWNQMTLAPTINQTGGSSGTTGGIYINPTLTAVSTSGFAMIRQEIDLTNATNRNQLGWFSGTNLRAGIQVNGAGGETRIGTFTGGYFPVIYDNGTAALAFNGSGRKSSAVASAVSTPDMLYSGTWFTGGTSITTKPHVLIEASGATSTGWNTAGTGLGINSVSGFTGNLIDLQQNGTSRFTVSGAGISTPNVAMEIGNAVGYFGIKSRSIIGSPADGILRFTNYNIDNFERLQFGNTTSSFPALQTASSNAQTGLAATFTNGSANIITVANTFAVNDVVQFTGTVPTGFATGTNYFIVGTPTSTQTGLTATFTNGNANIVTTTNNYSAGDVVQFTSTGTLPTGFALATNYYVIATGLTTTNIQVSATLGGAAITAASAGSGVQTVTRQPMFSVSATSGGTAITAASAGTSPWTVVRQTSATITNGTSTWTSTFAHGLRVGDVIRFTSTPPTNFATGTDYYVLTVPSTTTFTLANNLGGTAINAGSAVSTAIVFSRSAGIYVRSADNTLVSELYTGGLTSTSTWPSGSGTSVRPNVLIEPSAAANTGSWASQGTGLGINGPSGFSGDLLRIQLNGANRFYVNSTGQTLVSGDFYINAGIRISSPSTGITTLQNFAGNDFIRLQLGGTTASFPAIKKNGATIETRLADDSGFAAEQSLYIRFGSGTPEGNVTAPVGAIYSRTDGGANTSFYVKESGAGSTGWVAK